MINEYNFDINDLNFKQRDILNDYLQKLIDLKGSDLHIKSGGYIRGRINGEIKILSEEKLDKEDSLTLAKELLRSRFKELVEKRNIDFTHKLNELYRFRVNMFFQIDGLAAVFRIIPTKLPNLSDLMLPSSIEKICDTANRGIILVTGPTGSGKTTTLASMINRMNKTKKKHIITIEDPVEFVYKDENSVINQRSVGQDVDNFSDALRAALREDPDVILVGEMRDLETIETAIHAAETGHLVLSTLHTNDAQETVSRVVGMFPKEEQNRIKATFSSVVHSIISQRLVKTLNNKRRAAVEVMIKNARIKELILSSKEDEIYTAIEESKHTFGMQTFDQHLLELYIDGIIDEEEALEKSTKRNDLEIKIKNAILAREYENEGLDENDIKNKLQKDVIALKNI